MKKLIAVLLAIVMLLPLVVACKGDENPSVEVIKDGACALYYDATTASNDSVKSLQEALQTATGIKPDAQRTGEPTPGAIVLGNLKLPDGTMAAGELRNRDFMCGVVNGYYVIAGINHTQTAAAVKYFIESILPKMDAKDKTLTLSATDDYYNDAEYRVGKVTVGGTSLGRFHIQVPASPSISEWRIAVLLREYIIANTGYEPLLLKSDDAAQSNVIRIGSKICDATVTEAHGYAISINGTVMDVVAESVFGYLEAQEVLFDEMIFTRERNAPIALDNSSSKSGNGARNAGEPLEANGDVRIMFNNIHGQDEQGAMPVEQPTQMLSELYLEYLPDVLGMQECTDKSFGAGIKELIASEYALVDKGQNATALFYRTSTVECLESGYFGYNGINPADEIYADLIELMGGRFGASDIYGKECNITKDGGRNSRKDGSKGVTWGIFRVKETGHVFLVGSTHLWWENGSKGDEIADDVTRMIQMRALRNLVTEKATAFASAKGIAAGTIPIFIGGDYNATYRGELPTMETMESATNSHVFTNVNNVSTTKLLVSTHHAYSTYNKTLKIYENLNKNNNEYDLALDHIFINKQAEAMLTANYTGIIDDDYAFLSSDHLPIFTDVSFNESAPKIPQ